MNGRVGVRHVVATLDLVACAAAPSDPTCEPLALSPIACLTVFSHICNVAVDSRRGHGPKRCAGDTQGRVSGLTSRVPGGVPGTSQGWSGTLRPSQHSRVTDVGPPGPHRRDARPC